MSTPKVNAVVNAFGILDYLTKCNDPEGVTLIAKNTGVSASSCYNILRTLVDLDIVRFYKQTRKYEIGAGLFDLVQSIKPNDSVVQEAQPLLDRLSRRYNTQCGLWKIRDGNRVLVALSEVPSPARLNVYVGRSLPLGAGSAGRAILADSDADRSTVEASYNEVDWRGQFTFEEFCLDVKKTRKRGYAIDKDKLYLGVTTISAAFGKGRYCVGVFFLTPAYGAPHQKQIGHDVREVANKLASISQPVSFAF